MVLQQQPAKACVYGTIDGSAATVKISSAGGDAAFEAYEVAAEITAGSGAFKLFKGCLAPHPAGGDFTVTATCTGCTNTTTATLEHVTFGDVWYCGGQSNMALPLSHTLSRNISRDAIAGGKYGNLRIHGMAGNMNPFQPWATLKAALADRPASAAEAEAAGKPGCAPGTCDSDTSKLMGFSSTCYYFGESLSDELAKGGAPPPPIGLVHTAWGGSTIEQWLTNETIASCKNASISGSNQEWHDQRVMPYIGMTVKGWVWCESSLSATAGRSPFS